MAQFGCGGSRCTCQVTAGPGVTVTGNGSPSAPYVIGADGGGGTVTCDQVRPCFSAGPGATYNPATGVIGANVSGQAGNNLTINPDGSLYVPAGEATVTAGCGLTGDGSGGAPLAVATAAWPFACPPETNGTVVTCDANGVLRGEPAGKAYFAQYTEMRDYANVTVPAEFDVVADTFTFPVANPDPCRPVMLIVERESDVDFDLPAGAGAAAGQDTDEMSYFRNTGTTAITDQHVQNTKIFRHTASLAVGATATINFPVSVGRGSGGASYNRIQVFIRALMFTL
ncbi:hypothetical protein [Streptomyces sp. OE57]|uniref:hypothetical protein n=1 Tax=Streptomyces lacaronensis TaxID=3379885 RepID=UPI0039B72F67